MAIEIPNFFQAAGIFDGLDPTVQPVPIWSSEGVEPFDPSTTALDPVGGFTRIAPSSYLINLVREIDFLEGVVFVSCLPGKPGNLCAALGIANGTDAADGTVVVLGDGTDTIFTMGVFQFQSGLDGTVNPFAP